MKKLSRPIALLLACMLMVSMCGSAWATSTEDVGSIDEYLQYRANVIWQQIIDDMLANALVESEVITPSVPYTRVAGFKPPVTGTAPAAVSYATAARTMSLNNDAGIALLSTDGETGTKSGLELSKTVQKTDDGYLLTLEAFATGSNIITEVKEDIPTDIILVLDQSGSMAQNFNTLTADSFEPYDYGTTNSSLYAHRVNNGDGNLYYYIDGEYRSVNIEIQYGYSETTSKNLEIYWNFRNGTIYYAYDKSNGVYCPITSIDREGILNNKYTYTYTDSQGNTITDSSNGHDRNPPFLLYTTTSTNNAKYTYSYVIDGVQTVIEESTGGNVAPSNTYYYKVDKGTSITKLAALKSAVNKFVASVNQKAAGANGILGDDDDVNHRIAMVGFASCGKNDMNYENTEVFIGSTQYQYGTEANAQYVNAFQNMDDKTGEDQRNIRASIAALDADGATYADLGIEMANGIFGKNPIEEGKKRNRVVIVFTDGAPGYNGTWNNKSYGQSGDAEKVAAAAVAQASTAKNTYGATVYTIGIFQGCNVNGTDNANQYMRDMSSGSGYYLAATSSDQLSNVFEQISEKIESGSTSSTLGKESVIRDVIAPSFTLQSGESVGKITVESWQYTGNDESGVRQWTKNADALGAGYKINDDTVDVTGFDFSENWVGTVVNNGVTTYRGNKLVIKIPIVVKSGFLGGNNVPTNGADSGVYASSDAATPIETFTSPVVNVPIADITVTAPHKNVYLLGGVYSGDMLDGASITCGGVAIDPSPTATNYGLKDWQNAYVDINISTSNALSGMTEDGTYTVTCKIKRTSDGTDANGTAATEKTGNGSGSVNVFKPEVTYQDSKVKYLDTISDLDAYHEGANLVSIAWKHETAENVTDATATTMIGKAPVLDYSYEYSPALVKGTQVTSTTDVAVNVSFKIGETTVDAHTTTVRQACSLENVDCNHTTATSGPAGAHTPEFVVHVYDVLTTLTITKSGMETIDAGQSFLFKVKGPNLPPDGLLIAIIGNGSETISGLLVDGVYTVTEVSGWSWRYTAASVTSNALVADGEQNKVTVLNTREKDKWLDGDCYAENVFNEQNGN